ncbi:Asp-tRNA(Asn)/Glu-tRNA(Gln) amidotransferase subunit GatA [Candidatus Parcubacteria bacterium]|nr:Asp-tRNA(Asn)/Glu-tRNA(Gln) amidotransferase subunit GatA [Candidatus Parcubacteria bacterium]
MTKKSETGSTKSETKSKSEIRNWAPINEIANDVRAGKITALSNVEKSIGLIEKHSEFDAIISVLDEPAKKRAKQIDARVNNGEKAGRLAGVPFIAKDNFLVFGGETTAASNILKGFEAPYQATVINKLEAEGAICIAKANLDAFAHGSSTENSDFFVTKNPIDKTRVPGGSSGGSAAATALSLAPFSLGTDTGGSIRQPASFCNVVGFKPTYGLVSRSGVVAMASSLDVIGPITKSTEDAALIMDVIAGKDKLDMTMIDRDILAYTKFNNNLTGVKIGVEKEYMDEKVDKEVKQIISVAIEKLKNAGALVAEVSLPSSKLGLPAYYIISLAELSSNLSRYDGQRFGYSYPDAKNLDESYMLSRDIGFGDEAKRRIMIGTYVLSSGYYDAYYKKAQIVRTKIINESREAFSKFDFLIGPTTPTAAFKIGEKSQDPLQMYLSDLLTVSANLDGGPAISIPAGFAGSLPVGLHIMAPQGEDRKLLGIANGFEELSK